MDNFIFRFRTKIHSPYFLKNKIGKYLPDTFLVKIGVKQEDTLLTLLINYALEYAIGKVQANQEGLKMNGKHELLVNADDVN
jgi:hypothetical protein